MTLKKSTQKSPSFPSQWASGFKISIDIGTTWPSRIRLDHGLYRTDTRVGYFVEQTRLN